MICSVHKKLRVTSCFILLMSFSVQATDVVCKTPAQEWEDKYDAIAMKRVPSMFEECNPFSDIFNTDFFGDWLSKIKGMVGNTDLFCGYGTDDIFSDANTVYGTGTSTTPVGVLDKIESGVNTQTQNDLDKALNGMTQPIVPSGSQKYITGSESNSDLYDSIFK